MRFRDTKANGTIFMTLPLNLLLLVTQFLPLALLHLTPDSFSASRLRIMNPLYFLNGIKNNVHRSISLKSFTFRLYFFFERCLQNEKKNLEKRFLLDFYKKCL